MPRGNGTGPRGQGPGTGRGRMGGTRPGAGPGGVCKCPSCVLADAWVETQLTEADTLNRVLAELPNQGS